MPYQNDDALFIKGPYRVMHRKNIVPVFKAVFDEIQPNFWLVREYVDGELQSVTNCDLQQAYSLRERAAKRRVRVEWNVKKSA